METFHIQVLKKKIEEKKNKNYRFTQRSMARLLAIDSGSLSQILKGKRQIPKELWMDFVVKLKLDKNEKQKFLESLWIDFKLRDVQVSDLEKRSQMLDDLIYAEIISEWEFSAAICLFDIVGPKKFDANCIKSELGLSKQRANEVYAKLFQYGLLLMKEGSPVKNSPSFHTSEDVVSESLQIAHKKELQVVAGKISKVPANQREITSVTFTGKKEDIVAMKEWIRTRRKEFELKFEKEDDNPNEVFLFGIQLVPLLEGRQG